MQTIIVKRWVILGMLGLFQFTANLHSAVLTFDDVTTPQYTDFPADYAGMQWNNFLIGNEAISPSYSNGVVSKPNFAFNGSGDPASFSSANTFTLGSGHFKALFTDGTQLVVRGLLGGTAIYSNAYVMSSAAPTFLQFDYTNVNEVKFTTSPAVPFTMDNLAFVVTAINCTFALAPTNRYHMAGVETGSVAVSTQPGCEWAVSNTNSWLTITSGLSYTNTGNVSYTLTANTNGLARSGFVEIAGQAFGIRQYEDLGTNWADVVLTFDEAPPVDYTIVENGYGGLQWANFWIQNGLSAGGFVKGIVSSPDVAFNGFGAPASFSSSTLINLKSAYLTSVSGTNELQVRVQGIQGTNPSYDDTYAVSGNSPTLINFNYLGVDRVVVSPSPSGYFAMDNLTFAVSDTNVPQPVLNLVLQPNGHVTITFTGILQYASEVNGTFEDVPGYPQGTYTIPKANLTTHQYFRARGN